MIKLTCVAAKTKVREPADEPTVVKVSAIIDKYRTSDNQALSYIEAQTAFNTDTLASMNTDVGVNLCNQLIQLFSVQGKDCVVWENYLNANSISNLRA